MSTARRVPETWGRAGDGVWETVRGAGLRRLFVDAFVRLRLSDGFSHARSLAWVASLAAVQTMIALVGLSSILVDSRFDDAVHRIVERVAPGPVGSALSRAIDHARTIGQGGRVLAIVLGTIGALVTATTGMGQIQRALNRLYGNERDRPTRRKYQLALVHAVTAGVLATVAFASLAFGEAIGDSWPDFALTPLWGVARIPLGLLLMIVAVAVLFRQSPDRHQPDWKWLAFGASIAVSSWAAVTLLLAVMLAASTTFGDAYGPLAGIVALLIWAQVSSVAILYGAAICAQLEAVRAANGEAVDPDAKMPPGRRQRDGLGSSR